MGVFAPFREHLESENDGSRFDSFPRRFWQLDQCQPGSKSVAEKRRKRRRKRRKEAKSSGKGDKEGKRPNFGRLVQNAHPPKSLQAKTRRRSSTTPVDRRRP